MYRAQTRREVKLKEPTTRLSAFGRLGPDIADDENTDNEGNNVSSHSVRRVLSASALSQPISPMKSIANTLLENPVRSLATTTTDVVDYAIWSRVPLSTEDNLISPRPLGVTHILVVYAMDHAAAVTVAVNMADDQRTIRRGKGKKASSPTTFPEIAELPINDLLFLLNTPNLYVSRNSGGHRKPILPRRLHKEIPRVLMHVPHLQTFPELVIYLHTKNQAELFRKIIPEWMRDLMHPLPPIPTPAGSSSTLNVKNNMATPAIPVFHPKRLFTMLIPACGSSTLSLDALDSEVSSVVVESERTISSIAAEIGQTVLESAYEDAVLYTATLLDALRDNLCHIGYFNKDLWHELDLSRDILREVVSYQAKIAN